MSRVWAVARRELSAYFDSPAAYVVGCVFLLVCGYTYWSTAFLYDTSSLRELFLAAPGLLVVLAPAVSMRLISEELKTGTVELLLTLPARTFELVLGKFIAAWLLVTSALALTLVYPVSVAIMGKLDWGPVIGGYAGLALLSAALIAIGLMTSSRTNNQVVAFVLATLLGAVLWGVDKLELLAPKAAPLLQALSLNHHFLNIARGVIDSRDVVYYVSLAAVGLAAATLGLERQRR